MLSKERFANIDSIFNPKSVAVIGASAKKGGVGNDVLVNLIRDYKGEIIPVNPKGGEIEGLKAYTTLTEIPGEVDLAVVLVNAKFVPGVVDQAIEKKVKGIVIISAGFKEVGHEGAVIEKEMADKARAAGIPLVGPNCLGVINAEVGLNASFAGKICQQGSLAFISQSGALCTSVLDFAEARQMGFSKFVSFGNKSDVNETELLEYLADDPKTKAIALYLEDIADGKGFIDIASKIFWEKGKVVLCLKSGRSAEGAKAVSSHTGSLAGSDAVYDAIFTQSGVQRVDTISELFDRASLYTTQPEPKGKNLAIITNAGGPGIMATDAAIRSGLKLAQISDETKAKLKETMPPAASLRNPVDVLGDAHSDRYQIATELIMSDPNVDMGLVLLTPQSMTDSDKIGADIPAVIKKSGKPVVCAFMGAAAVADGVAALVSQGVPNYSFPEDAVAALGAYVKLTEFRALPDREYMSAADCDVEKAKAIVEEKLAGADEKYLTQAECRGIFECYNLPLLKSGVAKTAEEAAEIVKGIGAKVVMKVMSDDVKHKFDAGGVILNVDGPEAAKAAFAQIYANVEKNVPGAKIDSILIEQMAEKGVEVILGCNRDAKFGPLVMIGHGGTYAELWKDVAFRLAPMQKISAERMVRQIKTFKMLDGFRGAPKCDVATLEKTLLSFSTMLVNHPEIAECDINPLIVHEDGKGCSVADARIMLRRVK
ncbi:MAG: acetate--CoA ligase family protein [Thermoguttaceae bacterium]|nr:acetate--CoA ligase family protein [Thermoguttaceae bacterium]